MSNMDKIMAPVVIDYDWKKEISAIALAFKSMGIVYSQKLKSQTTITMFGQKAMTARQRAIFDKMNDKKIDIIRKKSISDCTAEIKKLSEEIKKINGYKTVFVKKETQIDAEVKKCVATVENILRDAAKDCELAVEGNVKGYLKGKSRKKTRIIQTGKHAVKAPLAVAAVPVGIFLSATGIGAPIGILATISALQAIKEAVNFIRRQKGGMPKLNTQINKTIASISARSEEYEALSEKAETDPEARKKLGITKSKIGKKEAIAYGFQTFLKVNKASIGKLDYLLDKYQKCVGEIKYKTVGIGKKIDKAESEISKLEKKIKKREDEIDDLPALYKAYGFSDSETKKLISHIKAKNDEAKSMVLELKKTMVFLDNVTDEEIDNCIDEEAQLEEWQKKLELFKSQRPASLQRWKKAIKILDFGLGVTSTALGAGSDIVSTGETALETAVGIVGNIDEASDYVMNGYNELKNQRSKHH